MGGENRPFKSGRNRTFAKKDLRNRLQRDSSGSRFPEERSSNSRGRGKYNSSIRKYSGEFDHFHASRTRFSPPEGSGFKRSRSPRFLDKSPESRRRYRSHSRERKDFDLQNKFSPPENALFEERDRYFRKSHSREKEFYNRNKFSPPKFGHEYENKKSYRSSEPRDIRSGDAFITGREIVLEDSHRNRRFSPEHFHEKSNEQGFFGHSGGFGNKFEEHFSEEPHKNKTTSWERSSNIEKPPSNDSLPQFKQGYFGHSSGFGNKFDEQFSEETINNQTTGWEKSSIAEKPLDSDSLPQFNPEISKLSAKQWLNLIEEIAEQNKWGDDEKRFLMTSKLAGFARQWYLSIGKNIFRWNDLRVKFLESFPCEMDYCKRLNDMLRRKKREDESIVSYFEHKVALLNVCDITDAKAVSCIIGGITNPKIRKAARDKNFTSINSLFEFLRLKEQEMDQFKGEKEKDKTKEDIKCFKCGQVGHKKRNCLSFNTCSYCRTKGHFEAECKIKAEEEAVSRSSNKVMFGALADYPSFPQYFKDVAVNGNYVKGYVDFSSEVVTIREETANKFGLLYRKLFKVIRSFGNSPVSCLGEVDATFAVDDAVARVKAYIVPDHIQAVPVIIGQAFTKQPHILITGEGENNIHISVRGSAEQSSYFPGNEIQSSHY